jgi:hypothetical protein
LEGGFGQGSLSDLKFDIITPEDLVSKIENVKKENEVCKLCNSELCLDDGESCSKSINCGGKYCIEGYCSNTEKCYDNDCKCSPDEIQCDDNKRCVKKGIIPLDVKPECGKPQECVWNYTNNEGYCAKSPSQIQEEENQRLMEEKAREEKKRKNIIYSIIGLTIIILSGVGIILHMMRVKEKEKQNTIQKEIENYQAINDSIIKAKKDIVELEKILLVKKKKKEDISNIEIDINRAKDKINELRQSQEEFEVN